METVRLHQPRNGKDSSSIGREIVHPDEATAHRLACCSAAAEVPSVLAVVGGVVLLGGVGHGMSGPINGGFAMGVPANAAVAIVARYLPRAIAPGVVGCVPSTSHSGWGALKPMATDPATARCATATHTRDRTLPAIGRPG